MSSESNTFFQRYLFPLTRPLAALAVALLLGGILIAVAQRSITAPFTAYSALFVGAVGDPTAWAGTLFRTMPLLLTGIAVTLALAAGLFNIGAEGQMAVGGLAAAWVGFTFTSLPAPVLIVLCLLASMAAGAAWGWLPAWLKEKRGAHEVITAILLNYIAQNLTRYLATTAPPRGLRDMASGGSPQTPEVAATLPRLMPGYDVHAGLILGVLAVVIIAVLLRRTVWGYETRAVGEGAGAAEAAGIPVSRVRIRAFMLAGALAGLAGAVLVLGEVPFRRFTADFYGSGYGFDGLAVALLAGGSPWGVLPAALLFGAMGSGAEAMAFNVGTPKQIVSVVQAILIVAVAARIVLRRRAPQAMAPAQTNPAVPDEVANASSGESPSPAKQEENS